MPWKQLILLIDKTEVENISDWLTEHGAQAVTYQDGKDAPIFEPAPGETPLWESVVVTALFENSDNVEKLSEQLLQYFEAKVSSSKIALLDDQQWERAWMVDFKAMQFGKNLWVCPSWEDVPDADAVNLILDPGLAFGSGTHETTALCLEWLESVCLKNKSVIDYGCGSGILGIAAVKLGATKVIGTDNDPQAIIASRDNAQRNNITAEQFELIRVDPQKAPEIELVDVIVANILAEPLRHLAADLVSKVRTGGIIALSGLLREQAEEIMSVYQQWVRFNAVKNMGNWCLLNGTIK